MMGRRIQIKTTYFVTVLAVTLVGGISVSPGNHYHEGLASVKITDGKTVLNELAQVSIDHRNTFKIREVNINRDALHLTLHRGTLAFFTPVHGRITGAVFVGDGEILVMPPNKIEKFQLNKFTGSPVLTERFLSAVFRFTDGTYDEIMKAVDESSPPEPAELSLENTWGEAVRALSLNLNFRILQNLLGDRPHAFFHAAINGQTQGWFEAIYDDRGFEPVLLGRVTQEAGISYPDIWCSFRSPRNKTGQTEIDLRQLQSYDIVAVDVDAEISATARLTATSTIHLKSMAEGERLLAFELSRELKLTSVEDENHHPLDFFQNSLLEASEIAQRGNDLIYVLLDRPISLNESITLVFRYSGDVITHLGNGIFFVGDRGTWYPNHGIFDAAHYHLKFHFPSSMALVATGNLIRETIQDSTKISEWDSEGNIGVAGFNFGDYLTTSQKMGQVEVSVFANRGLETVVRNLQQRLDQARAARMTNTPLTRPRGLIPIVPPEPVIFPSINVQSMLSNIIHDTGSALHFFESWFGSYPYKKLAISQIPGRFGQGWPSLCYVSTLTFLTREQQVALGMDRDSQFLFSQLLRAHEIAHQWWGNLVTSRSYHDTWLMEGTANYSAYLFAASKDPKEKDFLEEMRHLKSHLLEKTREGQTVESAGPIWLGWRLFSSKTPTGYQNIVYDKGAWVIHMLRMMMRDSQNESDGRFIKAIKDFLERFRGEPASTEDFKKTIEQHMTAAMDLENNHKMDWFFDEWVYDIGIPEYQLSYTLGGTPEKGFVVSGKVEQSGVPAAFEMPVPVFAHYGNHTVQIGTVTVSGEGTPFRLRLPGSKSKPSKISLNDNEAVLCAVKPK